jgi:uncharacterized protein YecE (DUF72 family)
VLEIDGGVVNILVGCCGWGYFRPAEFEETRTGHSGSLLQAYARRFRTVEVNSTFYRIPKPSTAEKWRKEAVEVNPRFVFTVKAYQGITHQARFGKKALGFFVPIKTITENLHAPVLLFQSPASFKPTAPNRMKMKSFFKAIDRGNLVLAWEPRGAWFDEIELLKEVCEENDLLVCVDPLRNAPLFLSQRHVAYFRLHGFGKPSMYRYTFSDNELRKLVDVVKTLPKSVKTAYVLFNNVSCYENARQFIRLMNAES